MSLKGLELQIAIPKTFDAGKIAEQKLQRSQIAQDNASALMDKQAEKNKETVLEAHESAELDPNRKHRDGQQDDDDDDEQNGKRNDEGKKKTEHPYKGSFVDFSG